MAWMDLTGGHRKAKEEFKQGNPEQMAVRSKTLYDHDKQRFKLTFLGQDYLVYFPSGEVEAVGNDAKIPQEVEILLLHYLSGASGMRLQNRLISFKELKGGINYIGPFTNRSIRPLIAAFGDRPERLVTAAEKIGGRRVNFGDVAVEVPAFPLIPVTCILWGGDDEFPASGNILFDASAGSHLATEDYAVLASLVVYALKRAL